MKTARRIGIGGAAGLAATLPMTLFMALARRTLPRHERRSLPPRDITKSLARAAGMPIDDRPNHEQAAVALAAHFAYGASVGAVYGSVAGRSRLSPKAEGAAFGLLVWGGNYLLGLPALGLLTPATEHPPRRVALMVVAHLVWGAALGTAAQAMDRRI